MKSNASKANFFSKLFFIEIFISITLSCSAAEPPKEFYKVVEINGEKLVYVKYQAADEKQNVSLSDLILSKQVTEGNIPNQLSSNLIDLPDFKIVLLQAGLAQLKNPETAEEKYRNAQAQAQKENKGIWYKSPTPTPEVKTPEPTLSPQISSTVESSKESESSILWNNVVYILSVIWEFIWRWINYGIVGAVISFLLYLGYLRFYVERRVRLLVIGKPSAGKTALLIRILNPKMDRQSIINLSPTKAAEKIIVKKPIRHGKFEIYPRMTDVPGSNVSTVWDELLRSRFTRSHILLVTLATTETNQRINDNAYDEKYLNIQLGYIQALIEGAMGARKTRKPKVVIFFLNKFDLFSSYPPNDSGGFQAKTDFENIFKEHIASGMSALSKAGIKFHVIIGSALENWNCDLIIEMAGNDLYGT
jgi:hypothetical protein